MTIAPTIRSRFYLLISLSVFFWFFCSLLLIDRINRILEFDQIRSEISRLRLNINLLNLETDKLTTQFNMLSPGSSSITNDKIEEICINLNSDFNKLNANRLVTANLVLLRNVKDVNDNVQEIKTIASELLAVFYQRGDLGSGMLNQWYSKFLTLEDFRRINPRASQFFEKIIKYSDNFLVNRDPGELTKLIEYWQDERSFAIPENSAGSETELKISQFFASTKELENIFRKAGNTSSMGLQASLRFNMLQVDDLLKNIESESESMYAGFSKKMFNRFLFLIIIFGGGVLGIFFISLRKTDLSVSKLKSFVNELKSGKVPDKLILNSSDDLEEMATGLNRHVESLNRKIHFADQIGESGIQDDFKPDGEEDVLGNSLLKMATRLREAELEESQYKNEEQKRRWHSEGMAKFGEIFRSEREDLEELAFQVIKNLVKYINANQGAIYLNNQDENGQVIDLVAAFAYDRRKYINRKILYGEGLIGTCALEKEAIFLTEIPKDYLEITSGIGQAQPRCLLIVPLKLENELFGIIELASFTELEPHETRFVEQLGEGIATTLAAVRINEKTVRLLEKSQKQAEEMARQEEKMIRNMQELQDAQEESSRKESEITGILNAVNSSSLVAEYSINGRFSDVNEKFLFLLESPRDQVVGKHHSDFSVVDKYSVEYKEFWKRLKDGETISQVEHFRLFNGNDIWLNQTYTPILDKNGKPFKILNISHDITQSKKQQESLEKQANEIVRRSLDMETLSGAVDASIIKCELSYEGIILDVNENYTQTTGYSRKELLGKNLRLFLKDIEKQQFEKIWSEVTKEKSYTGVIRRSKPTGEEVWLMATFSPVKNEEGDIYKTYFLAHDITEKKLKYQLLEEANNEIERLRLQLQELQNH